MYRNVLINIGNVVNDELRTYVLDRCLQYQAETTYKPVVFANKETIQKLNPFKLDSILPYETEYCNRISIDGIEYKMAEFVEIGPVTIDLDDDLLMLV